MSGQENEVAEKEENVAMNEQNQEENITGEFIAADAGTVDSEDITEGNDIAQASSLSEKDVESLQQQLELEREQASIQRDLALRTQAEMENLRKRTARDVENAHKYALDKFVGELLPIIDSLELGMNAASSAENVEDLIKGMELTLKMFGSAMEKFGVSQISPEGEKFNPEHHEAVSMQQIEGKESGKVVSVMQKGYLLNGRLIRPAMVIVSK